MRVEKEREEPQIVYRQLASDDGEGSGTPLQYSWLENPMDGGAWWAAVHGVASWTWLSDFTFTFHFHALEKEMATHSSVLEIATQKEDEWVSIEGNKLDSGQCWVWIPVKWPKHRRLSGAPEGGQIEDENLVGFGTQ